MLTPEHVIPIHYNTFDLIKQDVQTWAKNVQSETDAQVHVLQPGEKFSYSRG
jgi:L-ascorbate metabolism protein UlaG (beta-lactamase superfamily)